MQAVLVEAGEAIVDLRNHFGNQRRRNRQRRNKLLCWVVSSLILLLLIPTPAFAQLSPSEVNPVVIDGRPLFEVASTDQVSAEERAENIHRVLKEQLSPDKSVTVKWEIRNNVPVILVNRSYLMTVTQADVALEEANSIYALANKWTEVIREELTVAQRERSQEFLRSRVGFALAALMAAILVQWFMSFLWQRSLRPALEKLANSQEEGSRLAGLNLLSGLLQTLFRVSLWFGVVTYITNLFPFTRRWSYFLQQQAVVGFLEPNLRLGQSKFSILSLIILLGLLLALVVVSGILTNFLRSRVLRLTGINRGAREAISVIFKYALIFVGAVVLLQIWGLDLSSLTLIASALGVGIGLGLQNIAKDFGSGVILVFERPILVGDFVEFGTFQGTVERIGARSTEIRTLDQISIIVPNSRFLEQEVINWSHRNPISRIRLPVGVAYHSDPNLVQDVLVEVGHHHKHVLSKPAPVVFFTGFGDSALEFELLVWIADPSEQLVIKSDLYFAIEVALRKHNIEIPFPQRDLHLRSSQIPIEFSTKGISHHRQLQESKDKFSQR